MVIGSGCSLEIHIHDRPIAPGLFQTNRLHPPMLTNPLAEQFGIFMRHNKF